MKIKLSELRQIIKSVIKEESTTGENICSKFILISKDQFMKEVSKLSLNTGSDTDEAKVTVMNSKKIYKFNGTTDEANKNLSCIGMKMGVSNYDYYEPGLYSKQKPGYFYIGVY
jgi:hypothetical protein